MKWISEEMAIAINTLRKHCEITDCSDCPLQRVSNDDLSCLLETVRPCNIKVETKYQISYKLPEIE